jgi:hypothetical protein
MDQPVHKQETGENDTLNLSRPARRYDKLSRLQDQAEGTDDQSCKKYLSLTAECGTPEAERERRKCPVRARSWHTFQKRAQGQTSSQSSSEENEN